MNTPRSFRHWTRAVVTLGTAAVCTPWLQPRAHADGPKDNDTSNVRPVPPPGIELEPARRLKLEQAIKKLSTAIAPLRDRPAARGRVADIAILVRAVETALLNNEFFKVEDLDRADKLLALGQERAAALARGEDPWVATSGPTALGYRSQIDGTVQPYGVFIPQTWTPHTPGRWRLDTWFHGRNETLSELRFIDGALGSGGPFVRPDTFVIQPYGRFCNGSRFAGETDFFEALADLKTRFSIDDDRIVVRGFSLGGASAWHLTAHHAATWAAGAPGAGFSETRDFLNVFQDEKLAPPWWEEKLWQLHDSPAYVENFRNVALVAYSGEIDRQKQAADVMARALATIGIRMTHIIGPKTAHSYHPDAVRQINQLVDRLAAQGRNTVPPSVSVATPTLRYNRQAWVQIDGLEHHWERSLVEARLGPGGSIAATTRNTSALTFDFPSGFAAATASIPSFVVLDGQRIPATGLNSDRSWTASFHRSKSRWEAGTFPDGDLRKRHGLQGPIDDAFLSAFIVVKSTRVPGNAQVGAWATAEMERFVREWRRQFRGDARVKTDTQIDDSDIAANNLILWGDPSSNAVLARIADRLPIRWTQESITIDAGHARFPAAGHALVAIYPNPLNPSRYVVLNSGFTYREYDYLNNARQTPKLPDWAVVDLSVAPDGRRPGRIADADFFSERWELLPKRQTGPRP